MTTPSAPVQKHVPGVTDKTQYTDEQINSLKDKTKDKDFSNTVIAWTKSSHQKCRNSRQIIERQWYLNMAFYSSRQNVRSVPFSNGSSPTAGVRLYVPPAPYWRSRPVFNRIRPIVRKELAKLTAQKPSATVVPSTSEDKDLQASQAGEQIWDSTYRDKKLKIIFRMAVFWSIVTGNGFVKHYWDPTAKTVDGDEGDICFTNVTPFNLFVPDLLATDIEDQPYVIHLQTRSVDWVKLNMGIDVPPDTQEATDILNDSFLNLVGAGGMRKDSVIVYEVWVKPNQVKFMPKGGMFTIVGDCLHQFVEGNPYDHQQYPFTQVPYMPTGRFYGDSVVNDLISVQREYNRTRGQLIENKNTMGSIKLIAAEGSINVAKINTAPGQAIEYKLGYPPPNVVPPVPMPNYIPQEIDRLLAEFSDLTGQHDVSNGQPPPGVTAATAISFLQEQDETVLAATFQSIEEAYEKMAFQTLCYVKQYWTMPRTVRVTGPNNQFSVLAFRGSDIAGNTNIRIEAGSALPTSKAAKQALLMDLMSQGFLPPEKGLELMDIGGVQRLYDQLRIDQAQASRENMKMAAVTQDDLMNYSLMNSLQAQQDPSQMLGLAQGMLQQQNTSGPIGQPSVPDPNNMPQDMPPEMAQQATMAATAPPLIVPVNTWDNHQAHIQSHNDYRKSQEFDNLSPENKQLFEDHVNQHLTAMGMQPGVNPQAQASQQQAMMQQQQGPGPNNNAAPPGGGPPPDANLNPNSAPPPGNAPPMGGPPPNG